jgi:hypothetical protein
MHGTSGIVLPSKHEALSSNSSTTKNNIKTLQIQLHAHLFTQQYLLTGYFKFYLNNSL